MTLAQAVLACSIVALGATVQSSAGFGMALIAAPLLVLIDIAFVPAPMMCAGLALSVLVALRDRRSIDLHGVKWAVIGRIVGTVPAALLLLVLPKEKFAIAFGVLVLIAVGLSAAGVKLRPTRNLVLGAGTLSGFMATTAGIGGPPMALVYQNSPGSELRGTLSGFFFFGANITLLALFAVGKFGRHELELASVLLPGVAIGFFLSRWTLPLLDRGATRPLVLFLSAGAAIVVLWKAIL